MCSLAVCAVVPMDGFHLTRAQVCVQQGLPIAAVCSLCVPSLWILRSDRVPCASLAIFTPMLPFLVCFTDADEKNCCLALQLDALPDPKLAHARRGAE